MAEDVFEEHADLAAEWVRQACDAARGVVTAGLVVRVMLPETKLSNNSRRRSGSSGPENRRWLDDGAAAREIAQLKAEVASLRRPSVEVGAELLGKYSGDGNWYDVIVEAVSTDSARVRFRDYGNSEDVALSDLRAKGDDRDAVIAQLRADLAAQPRSSEDALRDTELASLRAELASYKDAERRASLLEETVASQAEEIRRLSETAQPADASAVFGAAPADAAGLFGAPPADADEVAQLKQRIAELEASDASEALAARRGRPIRARSEPWKKRTQMLPCIGGGQRTPPDGARRAQGQRGDSTRHVYATIMDKSRGSAGSCGSRRRTFRGR